MMVHPAPFDMLRAKIIAASMFEIHYTGKESHASAFPELGRERSGCAHYRANSAGPVAPTYPRHRSNPRHSDPRRRGPERRTRPHFGQVHRSLRDPGSTRRVAARVYRCFEAGALATGAKIAITGGDKPYAEMRHDEAMVALYRRNSEALWRLFPDLGEWEKRPTGSTDMGNVSLAMPSIHPMIGINSLPAVNHQPEFTAHCVTPDADKALGDGALAMAWTCIDLATDPEIREGLMARR